MSQKKNLEGYIILLKGGRNEKKQRFYLLPATREEINQFWKCWTQHIRPSNKPKELKQ